MIANNSYDIINNNVMKNVINKLDNNFNKKVNYEKYQLKKTCIMTI